MQHVESLRQFDRINLRAKIVTLAFGNVPVDNDMRDVHALWPQFGSHHLREPAQAKLPNGEIDVAIAASGAGSGARKQYRSARFFDHSACSFA